MLVSFELALHIALATFLGVVAVQHWAVSMSGTVKAAAWGEPGQTEAEGRLDTLLRMTAVAFAIGSLFTAVSPVDLSGEPSLANAWPFYLIALSLVPNLVGWRAMPGAGVAEQTRERPGARVEEYVPTGIRLVCLGLVLVAAWQGTLTAVELVRGSTEPASARVALVWDITVLLACLVAELRARRIARLPAPVVEGTGEYWQDAMRAQAMIAGYLGAIGASGLIVMDAWSQVRLVGGGIAPSQTAGGFTAAVMFGAAVVLAVTIRQSAVWFVARLWPTPAAPSTPAARQAPLSGGRLSEPAR